METNTFENLNLNKDLIRGVYLYGFRDPSQIQINGIKSISTSRDCIIQSQSGTGKTATYLLAILNKIQNNNMLQGIVIAPTRELANQIYNVSIELSKFTDIKIALCIGGTNSNNNRVELYNINLIIGTVGRIWYLITSKIINIINLTFFVLDEADDIVNNKDTKILELFNKLPAKKQIILISGTLSKDIFNLSKKFMFEPIKILLKNEELVLDLISQYYIDVESENEKFDTLLDLYNLVSSSQAIIYCNTILKLQSIEKKLLENNFSIEVLNSLMTSEERNSVLQNFRDGISRILLTTDLLARGIDIPKVNLVINYDLPSNKETYIHRIGRCGRFNKKGIAISIIKKNDSQDIFIIKKLMTIYKMQINQIPESFDIEL